LKLENKEYDTDDQIIAQTTTISQDNSSPDKTIVTNRTKIIYSLQKQMTGYQDEIIDSSIRIK